MTVHVYSRFGGYQPPAEVFGATHPADALCVEAIAPLVAEQQHTCGGLMSSFV
jgi:hypothetical protein